LETLGVPIKGRLLHPVSRRKMMRVPVSENVGIEGTCSYHSSIFIIPSGKLT
jgi:hypothetical protein